MFRYRPTVDDPSRCTLKLDTTNSSEQLRQTSAGVQFCHTEETEFFKISNLCSGHGPLRFASWWTFSKNRTMEQSVRKMWAELMSRKRL